MFAYEATFLKSLPILFALAGSVRGQLSFLPMPDLLTAGCDCMKKRQEGRPREAGTDARMDDGTGLRRQKSLATF